MKTELSSEYDLELYRRYKVIEEDHDWYGITLYIGELNARNPEDIPSFEHGRVHVYDYDAAEYLGHCGASRFRELVTEHD